MKWFETLFRKTRRSGEGASCSLLSMLAPSLLGMAVCLLSLCSLSWAWFNMSVNTGVSTIQSAMVEVAVASDSNFTDASLLAGSGTLTVTPSEESSNGTLYLIARGNVSKPTYLEVKTDSKTDYYSLTLVKPTDNGEYPNRYPVYFISISEKATLSLVCWNNSETINTTADLKGENTNLTQWPDTTTQGDFALTAASAEGEYPADTTPDETPDTPAEEQPNEASKLTEDTGKNGQTSEDDQNSEDPKQDTEQDGITGTGTSDSSSGETTGTTGDDVSGGSSETPAAGADSQQPSTPSTGNDTPGSGETTE